MLKVHSFFLLFVNKTRLSDKSEKIEYKNLFALFFVFSMFMYNVDVDLCMDKNIEILWFETKYRLCSDLVVTVQCALTLQCAW